MTKLFTLFAGLATVFASLAFTLALPVSATVPTVVWNSSGNYVVALEYLGQNYYHDMTLVQDEQGNLTGNGGSPSSNNSYLWSINSGIVTGDIVTFSAIYTATADAVNPPTTMNVTGVIHANGTMSGTWSDNYSSSTRSGTWVTTSGNATSSPSLPIADSQTVTVTIEKFVQGSIATAASARNFDFPMTATWEAANLGSGTGSYVLSETNTIPYFAITAAMSRGANYETKEMVNGDIVGAQCATGKPFALLGYTTGNSRAEAIIAVRTMEKPSFTNLQQNKFVIVWNQDCTLPLGEIEGEVVGSNGVLEVTSIEMIKSSAIANNSFSDGWKYLFNITIPANEPLLAMKFSNWIGINASGTIPVGSNMRISSSQASSSSPIVISSANMYSSPDLEIVGDLNPALAGRQIQILVEVAVPVGTLNGSYSTSYGVQSKP